MIEPFVNKSQLELWLKINRPLKQKKGISTIGKIGLGAGAAALVYAFTAGVAGILKDESTSPKYDNGSNVGRVFDDLEAEIASLPISYKTNDFSEDTEAVLLARMLFGEARNCSENEKIAIAYTAINRTNDGKKWNGTTLKEVILKPWQYSCFNKNDPNREKLMNPEKIDRQSFMECLDIAENVLSGEHKDPTNGATHYFNPRICQPGWAKKMIKIGYISESKHMFYKEG